MPWPYRGEDKTTDRCPCCDKQVHVYPWELFIITVVLESTSYWDGKPRPVLCVDHHGRPVRQGFAVTVKFHDGPIYVGVLPKRNDWKHGWWWPLDRVLWETEEEA